MLLSVFGGVTFTASAENANTATFSQTDNGNYVTWYMPNSGNGDYTADGVTLTSSSHYADCINSGSISTFTAPQGKVFTEITITGFQSQEVVSFPASYRILSETEMVWSDDLEEWVGRENYLAFEWTGNASEVSFNAGFGGMQTISFRLADATPVIRKTLHLNSGYAANIEGAQRSSVYFGNYKQSSDGSGGFNVDPVKWRVLSNADGKLFLLSDQNLDVVRYNESFNPVTWETCTLREWLNGCDGNPYEDSFIGTAFSDKETAAIAETSVVNDDNPSHGTSGGSDTTDKVFLLSIAQATDTAYGFTDNYDVTDARVSRNTAYVASGGHTGGYMYAVGEADEWWLRSPGHDAFYSSVVLRDGYLNDNGDYVGGNYVAVRPAFNLNLNSVLFTSSAAGGKISAAPGGGPGGEDAPNIFEISDYDGSEWKLTLLDDARAFAVTETAATAVSGGSVTLTYTGATTGDNEYVSVILADADGSAVYYGRLSQPEASGGAITVNLPALAAGSYTLKVFSEQYNGDYKTDYASAFSDVALTVISGLDAAKAAAKAELENYKDPADYRADEQTDLAAAIADGEAAIDAATDIDAVAAALTDAKAAIDEIKTDAVLTAEEAAAAALADAKADAKAELENYKNADDYRAAEQADLADAIDAGNAAIDAAADANAVASALADAKTAIDAIKTDAELTAEELAADTAAADAVEAKIDAIGEVAYTDESKAKIDAAKDAYDALTDAQKALVENAETLSTAEARYTELKAAAEAPEDPVTPTDPEKPTEEKTCPICGATHNKGTVDRLIGVIHRLIALIRWMFALPSRVC